MTNQSAPLFADSPYTRLYSKLTLDELNNIDRYLQNLLTNEDESLHKTHYFHDRFENIYLKPGQHQLLDRLMAESLSHCAQLLNLKPEALHIGYWFNLMQPGHVTTLHRHDDLDELISGVVYLVVPPCSGDLVIHTEDEKVVLEPKVGNYIYFDPKTPHEVTRNQSDSYRLSIGMNIGLVDPED